ncbi:MAG: hypothetical protein GX270_04560 [Clostridiaceae bacterium]|jgi:hypothetical protein|nr:hypothetical protein [Clostridiaceae bacterium]
MKKRIIAWVILIGFVLLILNILIFKKFLEASFIIYIAISAYFLLFMNKKELKR